MARRSQGQLLQRIQQLENSVGRMSAMLQQLQQQPRTPSAPTVTPSSGKDAIQPDIKDIGGSSNNFLKYFFPVSDTIGLVSGIVGRAANAYYKTKAARQMARGNSAQHLASALSTPQSQAVFGSPLSGLAKISADAGQANATKSLATGDAINGSLQDISNFISSVNTMRRLMQGDALSAMGLIAMQRMATANKQRGP
jgi:hypothetical protein